MSGRVGLLGGTFDPIHVGHLAAALAAEAALHLDEVRFIPSSEPPHRPDRPRASGYHRLHMASLAVAARPGWRASDVEIARGGASYTYDTLTALRHAEPTAQFFFITGADAFAEIAAWRHYPDVLDLAHFVVMARPGTSFSRLETRLPDLAPRMVVLGESPLTRGAETPDHAIFLINAETPDVSSTDIRRRAAAGLPIDGLVPEAVARYIDAHRLYV